MKINQSLVQKAGPSSRAALLPDHCAGVFVKQIERAPLLAAALGATVVLATGGSSTGTGFDARLISPARSNQQAANSEDDNWCFWGARWCTNKWTWHSASSRRGRAAELASNEALPTHLAFADRVNHALGAADHAKSGLISIHSTAEEIAKIGRSRSSLAFLAGSYLFLR